MGFTGDDVAHVSWHADDLTWYQWGMQYGPRPKGCFQNADSFGRGRFHYNAGDSAGAEQFTRILCKAKEAADCSMENIANWEAGADCHKEIPWQDQNGVPMPCQDLYQDVPGSCEFWAQVTGQCESYAQ